MTKKTSIRFFAAVFILYTLVYMTKNCFSAAMAATVDAGVLTKTQTGMINAVFYLLYAPLQLLGGRLADRTDPTRLIQLGLLGGAVANAVIFFFPHYGVMLIAWGFNAIVQLGVWPSVIRIISTWLHPAHRERATFIIAFSTSLGLMLAYLVAAVIGTRWEHNFSLSCGILLLLSAGLYILTRRMDLPTATTQPRQAAVTPPSQGLFRRSGLLLMALCVLLRTTVEIGVKTLSATLLMESYPAVSPAVGNALGAGILLSGIVGTLLIHAWLTRHNSNLQSVTLWLFILCVPALGLLCVSTHIPLWGTIAVLCLVTAATSGTHYTLMRCTLHFAPYGKSGTVAGLTNASAAVGIILQSTLTNTLAERAGWHAVEVSWLATIVVCSILTAAVLPRWQRFTKGGETP